MNAEMEKQNGREALVNPNRKAEYAEKSKSTRLQTYRTFSSEGR